MADNSIMYDANQVKTTVDGRIVTGFGPNDMVTYSFNKDLVTPFIDAQGRGGMAANNDHSGKITINLSGDSADHKRFIDMTNAKKEFKIQIDTPFETITGAQACFQKMPNANYGAGMPTHAYEIHVINLIVQGK
jgi:hypothetical protein